MKKQIKNQAGFTLIELLVVVLIVAVLAVVGIPLLSGNTESARMSEGVAGLGSIRTALRTQFANDGAYTVKKDIPSKMDLGIKVEDLDGHYFGDADYLVDVKSATTYCVGVKGGSSTAVGKAKVNGKTRSINEKGQLFSDDACTATKELTV
jgi:prepilin-type N-terminal cleavage/methylation domain-containing protein